MNELFVNIKVDREERPDIDHIYMTALHALGQQGGWPLTMFLSPDGKPMIGGHLLAARAALRPALVPTGSSSRSLPLGAAQRDRDGGPGPHPRQPFGGTLRRDRRTGASRPPTSPALATRIEEHAVDPVNGGLSGAPKFPNAPIFRFFWNEMFRRGDPVLRRGATRHAGCDECRRHLRPSRRRLCPLFDRRPLARAAF